MDKFTLGDTEVSLKVLRNGRGLNYFHIHEDESTSFEAGREIVKRHGGRLTYIASRGEQKEQNIRFSLEGEEYEFDPNTIFTWAGIARTLNNRGNYSADAHREIARFAKFLLYSAMVDNHGVVTLHNNRLNYNVESYLPGRDFDKDMLAISVNSEFDKRDFFFVTDRKIFYFLKEKDVNVVLQSPNAKDDGSLSVYCARRDIPYINVEAGFGHLEEQIKMLEVLQELR